MTTGQESIWSAKYRGLTLGIIFVVTAVAFEGLAVTTIAPSLAHELNGEALYGWVFSAFLLAQLVGTIINGQLIARTGPAKPFMVHIVLFAIGIIVAAIAPNMIWLIIGRIIQGLSAGSLVNCIYTAITLRYSDALRPQILAVFSSAYVLPSLIGPFLAGLIAEQLTWRYVFWFILPFVALAFILTPPGFKSIQVEADRSQRLQLFKPTLLAVATGALLTGLNMLPKLEGILLAIVGLVLMLAPIRALMPAGIFRAQAGMPATIATRGLFVATYFGTQTYLVYALTKILGLSADMAGLAVASASISWSTAANIQARLDRKDQGAGRIKRVIIGLACMLVGVAAIVPQPYITDVGWGLTLALTSQIIMGFGIGLAHPTSAAIAFSLSGKGEEGKVSADLAVADTFTPAVGIGIGGAIIAVTSASHMSLSTSIMLSLLLQLVLMSISMLCALRMKGTEQKQPAISRGSKLIAKGRS